MWPLLTRPVTGQTIKSYVYMLSDIEAGLVTAYIEDECTGYWTDTVLPLLKKRLNPRKPQYISGKGNIYERAKAAATVEDIASRYTALRSSGPNRLRGCCPIHDEKTPSFYIYLDFQRWKCFGACAESGDLIDLVQALAMRKKWKKLAKPTQRS